MNFLHRKRNCRNCLFSVKHIGLKAYGIIDENSVNTDLGEKLFLLKDHTQELYKEFARHILLNLNGMVFVQCIRDMFLASEDVNLTSLRHALAERGLFYPSGGKK